MGDACYELGKYSYDLYLKKKHFFICVMIEYFRLVHNYKYFIKVYPLNFYILWSHYYGVVIFTNFCVIFWEYFFAPYLDVNLKRKLGYFKPDEVVDWFNMDYNNLCILTKWGMPVEFDVKKIFHTPF